MRIVCPSCAAAYDVPEGLLSGRNAVRCARCATEWQPTRPEPPPIPVAARRDPPTPPRPIPDARLRPPPRPADPAAPKAIDRLMATPQRRQRAGLALSIAWLGSILLVAALLGAGYVERAQVMAVWPPSIRLYAALGLAGPLP